MILISRFLINLRRANEAQSRLPDAASASRFTIPYFHVTTLPNMLSDMGEPLELSPHGDDDEEGEGEVVDAVDEQDVATRERNMAEPTSIAA